MKTLSIVHVYYPRFWPELAECLRNVGGEVVITYVDEAAVAEARRDFPSARFLKCANRGYDVWPFLAALKEVDLDAFELVVKLQTKRDVGSPYCQNDVYFGGPRWRNYLLAPFRTARAWRRTLAAFADPAVGMVADRRCLFTFPGIDDAPIAGRVRDFLADRRLTSGGPRSFTYVAGTMFAVRAELLKPLQALELTAEAFEPPVSGATGTLAHVFERVFGFLASEPPALVPWPVPGVRAFLDRVVRGFLKVRYFDGKMKVKFLGVQIYHRRLGI